MTVLAYLEYLNFTRIHKEKIILQVRLLFQVNSKWFMALRVIWQYMDRSVTKKILYGPKRGPYKMFLVTDRSIYCHITRSDMNYLLYYTFYLK